MTKYKLVPVEPTQGMLAAGECALEAGCYASGIYADMLAAAPAVQGEPVAMVDASDGGMWTEILPDATVRVGKILYTTPQPAEKQPTIPYGISARTTFGGPQRFTTAEQQAVPDVAGLAEALEKARDAIGSLPQDALGNVPDTQQRQGWHIRDELIDEISTVLAAYWKGEE